jgi:diadenosine tetraphosphatase ApaH/serine/threonine PP2A family protein phosphatase
VRYPGRIHLLRGGRDNRSLSQVYGFHDQCRRVFGQQEVRRTLCDTFDGMSLAALIDDKVSNPPFHLLRVSPSAKMSGPPHTQIFCVHRGLGPELPTTEHIDALKRYSAIMFAVHFLGVTYHIWGRPERSSPALDAGDPCCELFFSAPQGEPGWAAHPFMPAHKWGPGTTAAIDRTNPPPF